MEDREGRDCGSLMPKESRQGCRAQECMMANPVLAVGTAGREERDFWRNVLTHTHPLLDMVSIWNDRDLFSPADDGLSSLSYICSAAGPLIRKKAPARNNNTISEWIPLSPGRSRHVLSPLHLERCAERMSV